MSIIDSMLEKAKDMTGLGSRAQLVLPREDGSWEVRPRGAKSPVSTFTRKNEAVQRATELAREQHTKLVIFTATGDVERKEDYS